MLRSPAIPRLAASRKRPLRAGGAPEFPTIEPLESRVCLSSPSGPEFLINSTTVDVQATHGPISVARDGAGNLVAVWESFNQASPLTWGIYGRRYTTAGVPLGAEFVVNSTLPLDDQRRPSVARRSSGEFVVAWDGAGVLGLTPSIYVQRFNAAGVAQGAVVTAAAGTALQAKTNASVAMTSSGSFVVVWEGTNQDAPLTSGVFARLFGADGTPLTAEIAVNQTTAGDQVHPVVALDSSGNFIVAWSGQGAGDGAGVFYRVFGPGGAALTAEQLVNTTTTAGTQAAPAVAMAPDDRFIIAWSGAGAGDADGVFGQRFSAAFAPIGGELAINNQTAGVQAEPSAAYDNEGDFMVVWSGQGAADGDGVYAREFRADGTARANQLLVNTTTAGTQAIAAITSIGNNAYAAVWSGGGSGDADGVFGRLFADDAPVLTTTGPPLAYTEGEGAVAIDPGLLISDPDHAMLVGATVAITGNFAAGQDVLGFVDQLGITGLWNPATGVLTLSGVASLASYQAALRSVTYTNSSENPSTAARTVTFTGDDGIATGSGIRTIAVVAVNDPPVVTASIGSTSYTENGAGIPIDPGLLITDADHGTLAGATVAITGNFAAGQDVLGFVDQLGITGLWNAATGVMTLSGVASVAAYQSALRSVTYFNTSNNPSTAARSVTFVVSDGADPSIPAARNVAVIAVNDPPIVSTSGGTATFIENGAGVAIDPGLLVTDADHATLAGATVSITGNFATGEDLLSFADQSGISGLWNAATGVLTLSGAASVGAYRAALRSVIYRNTSDDPSALARTMTFTVSDGSATGVGTRAVAITAVNDPPLVIPSGGSASYTENAAGTILDPALLLSDPDNAVQTGATVSITANFAPGQDVLGFIDQLGIIGSWNAATGVLSLSGLASVANYRTALRSVTYRNTSDNPIVLVRTVTFAVSDGVALGSGPRTIAVLAVNDAPVVTITPGSRTYTESTPPMSVDPGLGLSDLDGTTIAGALVTITGNYVVGEDRLSFTDQSGILGAWDAATGALTLTGVASLAAYQAVLRSVAYQNLSDEPGTLIRTIRFVVSDGTGSSAPSEGALAVLGVNDPPAVTTTGSNLVYLEGAAPVAVDPGVVVLDVDGTILTGAAVAISLNYAAGEDRLSFIDQLGIAGSWDGTTGVLMLSGAATVAGYQAALRSITYVSTSANPSVLTRLVTFTVSDGVDSSNTAGRQIAIISLNDPPIIGPTTGVVVYPENASATAIDQGVTILDPDSPGLVGATVSVTTGYAPGEDVLSFIDQAGIAGIWDPITGVLTLWGGASVAAYEGALRSVRYFNGSDNPSIGPRIITFTVDDGAAAGAGSRPLAVIRANDAPIVTTTASVLLYTEGDGPVALDPGQLVLDVDNTSLVGATVTIGGNYTPGQDHLSFSDQSGISGSWDPVAGVLTLSGVASVSAYQAALRSVTYLNASNNPGTQTRTVTIIVDDGSAAGAAIRAIAVAAITTGGGPPPFIPPVLLPPIIPPYTLLPPIIPPLIIPPPIDRPPIDPPPVDPHGGDPPGEDPPVGEPPVVPPVDPPVDAPPDEPPSAAHPAVEPAAQTAQTDQSAAPTDTVQVIQLSGESPVASIDLPWAAGFRAQFTTVALQVGGTLIGGYAVWLLISYSLARHSLSILPSFDPLDVDCLLRATVRRRGLAR